MTQDAFSGAMGHPSRSATEAPSSQNAAPARRAAGASDAPRLDPTRDTLDEPTSAGAGAATGSTPETRSGGRTRRKRGTRGGRRARRKKAVEVSSESGKPAAAPRQEKKEDDASPRRSKRGGRRIKAKSKTGAEAGQESGREAPSKSSRARGRRGGRRRRTGKESALEIESIPGEDDELPELSDLPEEAELIATSEGGEKQPRKGRGGRKKVRKTESKKADGRKQGDKTAAAAKKQTVSRILVNAADPEEVRVAVVAGGRITDLQMTVKRQSSYVNDIYRGRVVNLEPAIGAAFVDFGQGRNGFLHASDVLAVYGSEGWSLDKLLSTPVGEDEWDDDADGEDVEAAPEEDGQGKARKKTTARRPRGSKKVASSRARRPRLPIEKLLKKGQMVVAQITKDAIGDKGPTLTTYISIAGRYLVLMPSLARTGVSRKIEDEKERRRLKRILQALDVPGGMGVIVRTAGVGKSKMEIQRDLDYLLLAWNDFSKRLVSGRNPAPLYQESDSAVRTMRDLFGEGTEAVVVDDPDVHRRMVEFAEKLMPESVDRIQLHEASRPIFSAYGIEQDFEKIFQRRIELPSGGSIVLDQTEALVAIDVNSGRTRDGADFEDIALRANLEAAPEIARQIRLRDLGGIIVVDFIDMLRAGNRRAVERAFRDALSSDRARSKLGRISQFGLLELTRQRLGPGLSKLIFDNCPRCRGTGRRRSAPSRAQAILRRLGTALTMKGFTKVEVRAHPDVIEHLQRNRSAELERMREDSGRGIALTAAADQIEDSVLRYLRADGREVRPGGRRKH
ncbi:MAG: Rne/Rng family ribonuclease [Planctomycetota bacterium]|nr:Rne/Rng family ribonuclease [Planctomycetota bacterium]